MVLGIVITGRSYGVVAFASAGFMCAGLLLLGLADVRNDPAHARPLGFILLTMSVLSDSAIPNLQERLLRQLGLALPRMVALSNLGSFLLVFAFCLLTGELGAAVAFFRAGNGHARVLGLLLLQSACGYCGLRCYLGLVKTFGGVAAVIATSVRKVFSICLSFALFAKPFTAGHAAALALWGCGLLANVAGKRRRAARKKGGGDDDDFEAAEWHHPHIV